MRPIFGNGGDWGSTAPSKGYSVGKTCASAAVSWPPYVGGAGGYGHVAFVEKVLDGGKKFILVNIIGMYLMDMEKEL